MLTLGPRSADGSLCTAVAKAIILPLWGPRGIASWSLMTLERSGKGLSLQTAVCLIERSELWMVAFCGFRRKAQRASAA